MSYRLIAAIVAAFLAASSVAAGRASSGQAQLKYVVIVSRHGVRSPTWNAAQLNQYSAEPWPDWGVPPGNLTPHGRMLIELMGTYYRDWLSEEHLFNPRAGCLDAERTYIWADTDQRTLETGRAFAESLIPGCELAIHSRPQGKTDSLFSGAGTPNAELSLKALRDRLGPDSQKLIADHRPAFDALETILSGGKTTPRKLTGPPAEIGVSVTLQGKSADVKGSINTASTLSEDLLLEYANGMQGANLGWGRLNQENLFRVLELHTIYADLTRRTPYLARARGSNLLAHVLQSIEQAATGKAVSGAIDQPGNHVLILAGHDTNLSNISGILGLSWHLQGYQPDETPPGGAIIFSLWWDQDSHQYFVKTQFVAQTLEQMRDAIPLTISTPPAMQDVSIPDCDNLGQGNGCAWPAFRARLQRAIDPAFISSEAAAGKTH